MCIYMAGVDVHSADVSERERFAFSEEQVRHILQELVQKDGISGAVLLATCNRTELYLSVQSDRERTENNAAERQPAEQISRRSSCSTMPVLRQNRRTSWCEQNWTQRSTSWRLPAVCIPRSCMRNRS